jgi:flagellar hook-length control protein FliK
MNVSSTKVPRASDSAPPATAAGANNADKAAQEGGPKSGFESLIALLLQGGTPADDASSDPAALLEPATAEDDDADDADDLLASMTLAQFLPGAPLPTQAAARGADGMSDEQLMTAAAQTRGSAAGDKGGALQAGAPLLPDAEEAMQGLLDESPGAASGLLATGEAGASTGTATPATGLNAWAAAANRISSGHDAYGRPANAPTETSLREPVGTLRWKDELGTHLTLMAVQGQQSGSLRLSPEHLGPMEIQITVTDDKTNVQFGAQNADTRTALQDAMPRLREMFAAAGLQLGDAGVSGQAPRQKSGDMGFEGGFEGRGDGEPSLAAGPVRSITHSGLLDTYA